MTAIHILVIVCWLVWVPADAGADVGQDRPPNTIPACAGSRQLAVLSGQVLAPLLDVPLEKLSLLRASAQGLVPIPFQIDRRDREGRYILDQGTPAREGVTRLDLDDELVVRAADLGLPLGKNHRQTDPPGLVALRFEASSDKQRGWLYARVSEQRPPGSTVAQIEYDAEADAVQSASYRVGFSRQLPFLVDSFAWRMTGSEGWSPNLIDTMKIRHYGDFLGFIPFRRTQRDYTSKLIAVKPGPLRTIRRTENRVRMLWGLKTPAVYIDYVMMPDGFVMDTIIEIPFNVGLFFDDVETLTTVDWSEDAALPRLTLHPPRRRTALYIDGAMSAEEQEANLLQADSFIVRSSLGRMRVELDIPAAVPVTPWLYLRDRLDLVDPPENRPGQFGNVGFRTTGWERIDTRVQHMKFTVCLAAGGQGSGQTDQ